MSSSNEDRPGPLAAPSDDNPEWNEADFERARPASTVHGRSVAAAMVKRRGRPPMAEVERKEPISIRLSRDVLAFFRAKGTGWQTMIDGVLVGYIRAFGSAQRVSIVVEDEAGRVLSRTPLGWDPEYRADDHRE